MLWLRREMRLLLRLACWCKASIRVCADGSSTVNLRLVGSRLIHGVLVPIGRERVPHWICHHVHRRHQVAVSETVDDD